MDWSIKRPTLRGEVSLMNSARPARRRRAAADAIPDVSVRLYTIRLFDDELVVPWVELIDAHSDDEAIALARAIHPSKRREIWDRERLVAELPAF
jgi:hypothetical protein